MRVQLTSNACTVFAEPGDMKIKNESHLLHRVKLTLAKMGHDNLIKKKMWKDGHLTADTQHYLRSRKANGFAAFCIYDDQYQIRDAAEDYRRHGVVTYRRVSLNPTQT